jgi:(p)ppGpp synthase/HD superfamily hydrolase
MPRPRPLSERFVRALVYAARLHAAQFRKGTSRPYIGHLLGVASIVLTHGGDEDEAIAALLHDAVEDQGGKRQLQNIRRRFGPRVARIVAGCTDADTFPKPPWLERKKKYLRHLRRADSSVRLVSAADKLNNAREILLDCRSAGEKVWKRFHAGKKQTLWYYREVERILRRKGPRALVGELHRVVKELGRISRSGRRHLLTPR